MSKAEFDAKYPDFRDKVGVGSDDLEFSRHIQQQHSKKVKLYEFQIKKRLDRYVSLIIAPSYPHQEIDMFDRSYTTNGFNMKIGTLHKYGKLYPISMAQINKKMQDEINHYVRFMMEVAERNIPKYVTDKNKVLIDAQTALRSKNVNDLVEIDGNTNGAVTPLQPTKLSLENKELIALFNRQKEKGWGVSEPRLAGKSGSKFMGEIEIQEAGFQAQQMDIQEGLRLLIKSELETFKDIIVTFWDGEYFFKVTGGEKPEWYEPVVVNGIVTNPLTDLLKGDYFIKVDITTALRPSKERRRKEIVDYLTWLTNPNILLLLQQQGKTINIETIKKSAKDFGLNPETLLIDFTPSQLPPEGGGGTVV